MFILNGVIGAWQKKPNLLQSRDGKPKVLCEIAGLPFFTEAQMPYNFILKSNILWGRKNERVLELSIFFFNGSDI